MSLYNGQVWCYFLYIKDVAKQCYSVGTVHPSTWSNLHDASAEIVEYLERLRTFAKDEACSIYVKALEEILRKGGK